MWTYSCKFGASRLRAGLVALAEVYEMDIMVMVLVWVSTSEFGVSGIDLILIPPRVAGVYSLGLSMQCSSKVVARESSVTILGICVLL